MAKEIKLITAALALALIILIFTEIWIVYNLDPQASAINLAAFYLVTFLLVFSAAFVAGFYIRKAIGARELLQHHFMISLRQAVWLGLLSIGSLFMMSLAIYNWWNGLSFVLLFVCLEAYFLYK